MSCRLLADLHELGSVPCVYYFVDSAAGAGWQLDTASLALPLVLVTGDNLQPAAWTQVDTTLVPPSFQNPTSTLKTLLRHEWYFKGTRQKKKEFFFFGKFHIRV